MNGSLKRDPRYPYLGYLGTCYQGADFMCQFGSIATIVTQSLRFLTGIGPKLCMGPLKGNLGTLIKGA